MDGKVWAGTLTGGIWGYNGTRWSQPDKLEDTEILSILTTKDGSLWVGTFAKGLWQFDGTSWLQHEKPSWIKPYDTGISALIETKNGHILAGTWGAGLWSFDGDQWKQLNTPIPNNGGVIVDKIYQTKAGEIWLSYRDFLTVDGRPSLAIVGGNLFAGLYTFDGNTWHSQAKGFLSAFLESSNGDIWLGRSQWSNTHNWGLWLYNGTKWEAQEKLKGKKIVALVELNDGSIWAGTQHNGLWKYDGQNWYLFSTLDGLPSESITGLHQDQEGSLWVGTGAGIARYRFNSNPPAIKIKIVDEKEIDDVRNLEEGLVYTTGKSGVFVIWSVIDKETPTSRLTYQYRMNQGEWSQPTAATSVTTPPMDSGKHTFAVRAIDRDANHGHIDSFTFKIDLDRPVVQISSPKNQTIVGGMVQIMGSVTDDDLSEFLVEYALGDTPSNQDFKLISKSDQVVVSDMLAKWDTQPLPEVVCTIRIRAMDELEHEKDHSVTIVLDKTPPTAELVIPQDNSRLTRQTKIKGIVADQHLDRYVLEYTTDPNRIYGVYGWDQITQKFDLLEAKTIEDGINRSWEIPSTISGRFYIRLTAFDAAENRAY